MAAGFAGLFLTASPGVGFTEVTTVAWIDFPSELLTTSDAGAGAVGDSLIASPGVEF